MDYKVKITLLAPLQLSTGQADIIHDSDAAHDEYGLPVFPAKRLKGLLFESALEMAEISNEAWFTRTAVATCFGHDMDTDTGLRIDNFTLADADEQRKQWKYLKNSYPSLFSPESVWKQYSDVVYQTAIDKETGIADEGSLRNKRVVIEGTEFVGTIHLFADSKLNQRILQLALLNLRYAGSDRNRGCGRIACSIIGGWNDDIVSGCQADVGF